MTINIEKKHILIFVGLAVLAVVGIIGMQSYKNKQYEKNIKICQENVYVLYFMSSILSAEIHDTWRGYIFDDKKYVDPETGKFYKSRYGLPASVKSENIMYCSSFSEAIAHKARYFMKRNVNHTLDSLYSATKALITQMTPAPSKHEALHRDFCELFLTSEAMYNYATNPEGSLQSYTSSINTISTEYNKHSSNIDIQIGEIEESKVAELKFKALLKF